MTYELPIPENGNVDGIIEKITVCENGVKLYTDYVSHINMFFDPYYADMPDLRKLLWLESCEYSEIWTKHLSECSICVDKLRNRLMNIEKEAPCSISIEMRGKCDER